MITQEERVVVFSNAKEVRLVDQLILNGLYAEQFAVALQPTCVRISNSPMISSAIENQNTIYITVFNYSHPHVTHYTICINYIIIYLYSIGSVRLQYKQV